MMDVREMARRAGADVREGDLIARLDGTSSGSAASPQMSMVFTVIPLLDAVRAELRDEQKDLATYEGKLYERARRPALEVGKWLHGRRVVQDGAAFRVLAVSECPGLADEIRGLLRAEIPLPVNTYPVTKAGVKRWDSASKITDVEIVNPAGSDEDRKRIPVWLSVLVSMVWHEYTKRDADRGAAALPYGLVESVTRAGKIATAPAPAEQGEHLVLDRGEVIAAVETHAVVRSYAQDALTESDHQLRAMPEGEGLEVLDGSGAVVVDHSAVEEIAFSTFRKEMESAAMPLVFETLARQAHEAWAEGRDTGRLVYRGGVPELARAAGLVGNKAPAQVVRALKLMEVLQPRAHYKGGEVMTLGLLTATGYEGGRGKRGELVVNLNDCMRPGYAAELKRRGITSQWLVPLQELNIDQSRWHRAFGTRGLAGARRFKLGVPLLFMPGADSQVNHATGARIITDDQLLEFADRCKWNLKPDKLIQAKQLLVSPPSERDGQLMIPGLATAPLERVDGGAIEDGDGLYTLADKHARMRTLANLRRSKMAKMRRGRRD